MIESEKDDVEQSQNELKKMKRIMKMLFANHSVNCFFYYLHTHTRILDLSPSSSNFLEGI